jgi:hypothetical protein
MGDFIGLYTRASFVSYSFYAAKQFGVNAAIVLNVLGDMVNWTKDSFSLDRKALCEKTFLGRGAINTAFRALQSKGILAMKLQGYPCTWSYTIDCDRVLELYLGDGTRKGGAKHGTAQNVLRTTP